MRPERLWWWSTRCYQRGWLLLAKLLKLANYVAFKAVLPYECDIAPDVTLWHRGLSTVVHPNTTIGRGVRIGHGATLAAGSQETGSPHRVVLADGVEVGTGAFVAARKGVSLTIGEGAKVGAHAVVTSDVPAGVVMVGPKAQPLG